MRIKLPITGTVAEVEPYVSGDDNDPIRLIDIDLGHISWKLIHLDLEAEEMEIEIKPSNRFHDGVTSRFATEEEKQAFIKHARDHSLERMSKQALYALSKSPRLKNPFKEK